MDKAPEASEVIDILEKWGFFYGQRAGRELWSTKPKEVQDADIEDFKKDLKKVVLYVKESAKNE